MFNEVTFGAFSDELGKAKGSFPGRPKVPKGAQIA